MTTSEDTDWEMFELWETLKRLMNCHQGGQESPNAFRKRLEENAKGVQALLGNTFLYDFAETTQGYQLLADDDERDLYKNNVWEMLLASGMMFNSHRERYQSRIDAMNSQFMVTHMDYSQRMTFL